LKVVLCGGGTGGHVYPALSVAAALRVLLKGREPLELLYLAGGSRVDADLIGRFGIPLEKISSGGIRGRLPWEITASAAKIAVGLRQALRVLKEFRPHVVFSTGGYVSFPVTLAASRRKVPLVIYLPDLDPGWAVRVSVRFAAKTAVSAAPALSKLPRGKAVVTGYPVRDEFWEANRTKGRERLGINDESRVLLVSGASQGSQNINQAIATNLLGLLELCEVIHLCGPGNETPLAELRQGLPAELAPRYHLHGYLHDEFPWAMAAADLAVCRAGASVLGELPAAGLPAILVPYRHAGGHQRVNAQFMEDAGAALIVEDRHLQKQVLPLVGGLLSNRTRLEEMAEHTRKLARRNAAGEIAELVVEAAKAA